MKYLHSRYIDIIFLLSSIKVLFVIQRYIQVLFRYYIYERFFCFIEIKKGLTVYHFLHIGKTGGSAIKEILK